MKQTWIIFFNLLISTCAWPLFGQNGTEAFLTKFEQSDGRKTVTYKEGMDYYIGLSRAHPEIKIIEMGLTDSGHPLHLVLYDADQSFNIKDSKDAGKGVFLINNAIHPGESDGVDASMMLLRDIAQKKLLEPEMREIILGIIPFYNIGGVLNRNQHSRVNQNGPEAYGFRGNARNYDLNRDFIKSDTRNARSFAAIFHFLDPDLFMDTHVSNGADYQYTMTLDYAQKDKLGGSLKDFQETTLLPYLFGQMKSIGFEMIPYVNVWGTTPDMGYRQFPDWPRYSSGYAALFHTIGFMSETHMLKPYKKRVNATLALMESTIKALDRYKEELILHRLETKENIKFQETFPIKWELDTSIHDTLIFKGYEGKYIESTLTSQPRLYYDHSNPYTKKIPYYNLYKPSIEVNKPEFYVVPQGWHQVIDLLKVNQVNMALIPNDTLMDVEIYHISDYKTSCRPYEGHFYHYDIQLQKSKGKVHFRKGDFLVPVNQSQNRYIVETLEPQAEDSFFKWNFFDPILQRKEGFSPYVFEDLAVDILKQNPDLKKAYEARKKNDVPFSKNRYAQLNYIYANSDYSEAAYLQYPIFRLNKN
jgi:hypothetical protein